MKTRLQEKLKKEGRSLRWFHKTYIRNLTYNALALQLNGYATVSEETKDAVNAYLSEKNG